MTEQSFGCCSTRIATTAFNGISGPSSHWDCWWLAAGALIGWRALISYQATGAVPVLVMACLALVLGLAFLWIFWVKPERVKLTAEAFAERLRASCEVLWPNIQEQPMEGT